MQKIFREIIEELKKKAQIEGDKCAEWVKREDSDNVARYNHGEYCYLDSVHTVERFVKKSDIGWIPCDERYPDTDEYIMLSFENFSIPIIGRYEEDAEGGAFYAGDEDESLVSHGLIVNAWRQLPEPYRGKECDDRECPFHQENGCPAAEGCPGFESSEPIVSDEINELIKDIERARFIAEISVREEFEKNGETLDHEYMRGRMCAFEDVLAKLRKITI